MSKRSDDQIIKDVVNGNTEAFSDIIKRYHQKVLRYTCSHLNNFEEAEDAAQEIFLAALESLKKFRGESQFSTWLYSITANYCKNNKRQKRHKSISLVKATNDGHEEILIHDERQNTESDIINNESLSIIKEEILELTEQYKNILILRDIEGLSYDEISKIIGISLPNVKVRIHRGREMLMRRLSKRGII